MNKVLKSRRGFIKKAIYKTPILLILGSMNNSVLYADASGGPDGPPGGFSTRSLKKATSKKPRKRLRF